jgi:serpin B
MLQEHPEDARVTINHWVSNQTEDKIRDVLPTGALDSNTVLVLVNTIYFKVRMMERWSHPYASSGLGSGRGYDPSPPVV